MYKSVWQRHWHEFKAVYPYQFSTTYRDLTPDKISEVYKRLGCGDYRNGFRKHACPECGTYMIETSVFSYFADREWRKLWKTHMLLGRYFRMKPGP